MKYMPLVLLALFFVSAHAETYYLPPSDDLSNAHEVQEESTTFLNRVKQQFSDLARSIIEVFQPITAPVGAFFTTINDWIGELVFLLRLIIWSWVFVAINWLVFVVFGLTLKAGIKVFIIYSMLFDPDRAVSTIQNWTGQKVDVANLKQSPGLNSAFAMLKLFRDF